MAIINLSTEKIIDCKEGSKTWWHEQGHIEFSKLDKGLRYQYYSDYLGMWFMFFISVTILIDYWILKFIPIIISALVLYYYFYEELWAWRYAYKNKDKWN